MIKQHGNCKLLRLVEIIVCLISVATVSACITPVTPTSTPPPTPTTPSQAPKPSTPAPTPTAPAPIPPLTTTSLPLGRVGAGYSGSLVASGGTAPYTWSLVSGSLPPGLALSAAGVISGTATSAGTFNFNAQVKDSGAPVLTSQGALSIIISPPPPTISTTSLPSGRISNIYSVSLVASSGTAPYTWYLVTGNLPPGLGINAAGIISGTPITIGTFNFTVQVWDSSTPSLSTERALSITILPPPLTINTASLPLARTGISYTAPLLASDGTVPYTWSLLSGSLPPGLSLSAAGIISGTPTSVGIFDFTVQVQDSSNPALITQGALSISVAAFAAPPLVVITPSLPLGRVGVSYSVALVASGGTGPYTWSIVNGSLPPGLSLSANGIISGTPSFGGTFNFTVQVMDNSVPVQTTERAFVLVC